MTLDEIKELAGHRKVSPWVVKLVQDAVELEREKAAKVCDDLINEETCYVWIPDARGVINNCAAAIRSMK